MSRYLYKLIQQGEHGQQDFKFCINDSKKIAITLSAFANTNGGRLLIGVKDNGKIAGISSDEEFYMIESAAQIYSRPVIHFTTQQHQTKGKTVLEITIVPGNKKPYLAQNHNGKWLAYTRINDENVLAHPIQIEAWKKQRNPQGIYFSYADNERLLINYLQKHTAITLAEFMQLARISRKQAGDIFSNFMVFNILQIHTLTDKTFFTLNPDFDKQELTFLKETHK